ncbi:hypothetical protein OSTOST_13709, partial [Ostertagia ostertagi]
MVIIIVCTYVVSIGTVPPFSTVAFKENAESVAQVKKIDPTVDLGENFALVDYGTAAKLYILYKCVHTILLLLVMIMIVKHTSMVLRNQARFSEGSRKMHQEAIRGLTVQTIAVTLAEIVPVLMLCVSFYVRKITFETTTS